MSRTRAVASAAGILALTLVLGACTPWPEHGNGGLAERHYNGWGPLLVLRDRYQALTLSGADRYFPGRLVEIRNLMARATREHEGGLAADALVTVSRAGDLMTLVEADMQTKAGGRPRPRG